VKVVLANERRQIRSGIQLRADVWPLGDEFERVAFGTGHHVVRLRQRLFHDARVVRDIAQSEIVAVFMGPQRACGQARRRAHDDATTRTCRTAHRIRMREIVAPGEGTHDVDLALLVANLLKFLARVDVVRSRERVERTLKRQRHVASDIATIVVLQALRGVPENELRAALVDLSPRISRHRQRLTCQCGSWAAGDLQRHQAGAHRGSHQSHDAHSQWVSSMEGAASPAFFNRSVWSARAFESSPKLSPRTLRVKTGTGFDDSAWFLNSL
jgi:hypothetical protein